MRGAKKWLLKQAKDVFFEAMLDGYAGGANRKSTKTKTRDGYTTVTFIKEDFKVVDRWCKTPYSDKSGGTTTIFYMNVPIWWMSYSGMYPKAVIPFLKSVLKKTYEKKKFLGGRGEETEDKRFFYKNFVREDGNTKFEKFAGCEEILETKLFGQKFGFHEYSGMSLL